MFIEPETVLRLGTALVMVVFGVHQMLWPHEWFEYLPAWLKKLSPVSDTTDMRLHAVGNIFLGLWFGLAGTLFPFVIAWLVLIWWLSILPFAFRRNWSIGMRDTTIIFGVIAYLMILYK